MNFAEGTKLTERVNLLIGNFSWSRLYRVEYLVEWVIPGLMKIIVAMNETVCSLLYVLVGLLPILVENQIYRLFQAYNRYFTVIVLSTVSRNCTHESFVMMS